MKRQVILLEDLVEVFLEELGHVLDGVNPPGHRMPHVYPAETFFLS